MSNTKSDTLMSATKFAKLCGVSVPAVLGWVSSGKLRPTQMVGGKCFFSVEDFCSRQISEIRSFVPTSFLGVIVEDTEDAANSASSLFEGTVKASLPKAIKVDSLSSLLRSMVLNEVSIDDRLQGIIDEAVVRKFRSAVSDLVFSTVRNIIENVPSVRSLNVQDIIDVVIGEKDASLVARYNSCCDSPSYTAETVSFNVDLSLSKLERKYGLSGVCIEKSVSLKSVIEGDSSDLLGSSCGISYSADNQCSVSVRKDIIDKTTSMTSRQGIKSVVQNGYYSVVKASGSLSSTQESSIMSTLAMNEFSTVYLSNRSRVSAVLLGFLDALNAQNKITLIEPSRG